MGFARAQPILRLCETLFRGASSCEPRRMRGQNLAFALRDARKSALLTVTATTYTVWNL